MEFTTLEELNEALRRPPKYNYAWLQLDNYLVVDPDDDESEDCFTRLEDRGYLPLTVAWFSREGHKVRIYQRAEGISSGDVLLSGLTMSVLTGADERCLVASRLNRFRDYDDLGDESLQRVEPAALDERALRVLTSLLFLSECLCDDWSD